jgi:hypothetical protein
MVRVREGLADRRRDGLADLCWTISRALVTSALSAAWAPAFSAALAAMPSALGVARPPSGTLVRVVGPQPYGCCGSYAVSPTLIGSCASDFGQVTGRMNVPPGGSGIALRWTHNSTGSPVPEAVKMTYAAPG